MEQGSSFITHLIKRKGCDASTPCLGPLLVRVRGETGNQMLRLQDWFLFHKMEMIVITIMINPPQAGGHEY